MQLKKCPALKSLPATGVAWASLRELDLRAAKKQVCKVPPDVLEALELQKCMVRGGVQKKGKKKK